MAETVRLTYLQKEHVYVCIYFRVNILKTVIFLPHWSEIFLCYDVLQITKGLKVTQL